MYPIYSDMYSIVYVSVCKDYVQPTVYVTLQSHCSLQSAICRPTSTLPYLERKHSYGVCCLLQGLHSWWGGNTRAPWEVSSCPKSGKHSFDQISLQLCWQKWSQIFTTMHVVHSGQQQNISDSMALSYFLCLVQYVLPVGDLVFWEENSENITLFVVACSSQYVSCFLVLFNSTCDADSQLYPHRLYICLCVSTGQWRVWNVVHVGF